MDKAKIREGHYEFSIHAEEERQADKIEIHEIEKALLQGEILEDYPNNPRGECCLVLGYIAKSVFIHVVCGKTELETLRIITVYIPAKPKWIDEKIRRKK